MLYFSEVEGDTAHTNHNFNLISSPAFERRIMHQLPSAFVVEILDAFRRELINRTETTRAVWPEEDFVTSCGLGGRILRLLFKKRERTKE